MAMTIPARLSARTSQNQPDTKPMMPKSLNKAFTLVEMLLVVAIISILAAMAISNFSNAAKDTRDIVARQQLAVVQEAVNHWVNHEVGRVGSGAGSGRTVSQVMASYNAATSVSARYGLFQNYLDEATRASLALEDSSGKLSTQSMRDVGKYLLLPDWAAPTDAVSVTYPKVQLL